MGKNKYIETPEKMYGLFNEYKKRIKDNPRLKMDFKGKDADKVFYELEIPFTMEGFENYVASLDIIQSLDKYFANTDDAYDDYRSICSRITREIRQDQIEGGMAGIYNPSITQRLNGLVDKQDLTSKGGKIGMTEIEVKIVKDGDQSN